MLAPAASNQKLPPPGLSATRDTLEYRTALELELWKEEQEELFGDQVSGVAHDRRVESRIICY